jgi:Domain of unknown function (DUF4398)
MSEATISLETPVRSPRGSPVRRAGRIALGAAAVLAVCALGACASQPKPIAQLVRAKTLVSQAEESQAQRYAPTDLQRARDELDDARKAESNQRYQDARALADRAAADADLANARAASGKAQQSAGQVRHSLDTLRQQLQQSQSPSGTSGSGASGSDQDQP